MKALLRFFAFFCAVLSISCAQSPSEAGYDEKVSYRKDKPVKFPHFTLVFTGIRRVVPPQYPRGWDVYDFRVEVDGKTQTVSWSAGTGSIGPAEFKVGSHEYWLERVYSDKLGKLKDAELVITKARK